MSQIDNIIIQVRSQLQATGIKLWLTPYFVEEIGICESSMENLAEEFSIALGIQKDYALAALNELQSNALEKLKARNEFQTTGVATLKIKALKAGETKMFAFHIKLCDSGRKLHEQVAQKLSVADCERVKLIAAGRVVQFDKTLEEQCITNNQQLMALVIEEITVEKQAQMAAYDRVRKAKEDAALMLKSKQQNYMRMEDQDGNAVHLPPNEKNALLMALALHEKGRIALKRKNYDEALVLFLEADDEFSSCNSKILQTVDNYALLNLDIVWCYLCLKSLTHLPDAQRRLDVCEQNFNKSYGRNLDRVVALKGTSANEKALVLRLHLLQAVNLFHQNNRNEARGMLMVADSELRALKIDEGHLTSLVEMGYSPAEARVALRSCGNNLDSAITFILERREKKREARKQARNELALNREIRNCNNEEEDWVNPRTLNSLVTMGYETKLASAALKKSKNDLIKAIDLLHNDRDSLADALPAELTADEILVEKIVSIGFDPEMAKFALEHALNNSERAIELLLKMQKDGNYQEFLNNVIDFQSGTVVTGGNSDMNSEGPSTSQGNDGNKLASKEKMNKFLQTELNASQAYGRFSEDFEQEDDEYLDLPLIQEENILLEYKRYLGN